MFFGKIDASLKTSDHCRVNLAVDGNVIDAVHVIRWVREQIGQLAVIGQKKQARRVHIEAANTEESYLLGVLHEIDGPFAVFWV